MKRAKIQQRDIDILFNRYTASHQNPINKVINCICIPVVVFGLLGLAYAIPFPHLGFLGQYASYINWVSLVIAFSVYFYMKISPILSYIMLLVEFLMGYGIMQLADWQKTTGPGMPVVCFLILMTAYLLEFIGQTIERKRYSFTNSIKFQFYGPIWLVSLLLKKLKVKY